MLSLRKSQSGISHVVAVMAILAIGVIGAVALRISSAQRLRPGYTFPTYTQTSFPTYTAPTYTQPTYTYPSTTTPTSSGTSGSTCTANGAKITAPAGSNCSISSVNGVAHCYINNQEVACQ